MASTYEKMQALAEELREQAISDTSEEMSGLLSLIQMAAALGIDVFAWLLPDDPAQADIFVDQIIALFLRVRGDDLPPFDPNLYGEARASELAAGALNGDKNIGLPTDERSEA